MKNRVVSLLVLMTILVALVGVLPAGAQTNVGISIEGATLAGPGGTVALDITIDATTQAIRAVQFDLSYNPAVLDYASVSFNPDFWTSDLTCQTPPAFPLNFNPSEPTPGLLQAFGSSPAGVPAGQGCLGSGVFATVTFNVLANGTSNQAFSNFIFLDPSDQLLPVDGTGSAVRVGPAPVLDIVTLTTARVDDDTFEVNFSVDNTGVVASDPTGFTVTASSTAQGSATGTIPALAPSDPASAQGPFTFDLTGGATSSTVVVALDGFGSRSTLYVASVNEAIDVPVDASFLAFIDLTTPAALDFGFLALGPNSVDGMLNVKCNTDYAVNVFSARNFHMTQFDGAAYGAASLFSALQVVSAQNIVTEGSPALLLTGDVTGQIQDLGENFPFYLSQVLTYQDPLLPSGQTYHDVLTFNAYVTF